MRRKSPVPTPERRLERVADGFTLLEVLVALLVAGMVLGIAGRALSLAVRTQETGLLQLEAVLIARSATAEHWLGREIPARSVQGVRPWRLQAVAAEDESLQVFTVPEDAPSVRFDWRLAPRPPRSAPDAAHQHHSTPRL